MEEAEKEAALVEAAEEFLEDLAGRLALPELFDPGPRPQLSMDGWGACPESIESAFVGRCHHGVLIKDYRKAEMPGRYGPPELISAIRQVIRGDIEERDICTSHCERSIYPSEPSYGDSLAWRWV